MPHFASDLAMQLAHSVRRRGKFEREHGHAESRVLTRQIKQLRHTHAELRRKIGKVSLHEIILKNIVASGNGSMSCKDSRRAHRLARFVKKYARLYQFPCAFQH